MPEKARKSRVRISLALLGLAMYGAVVALVTLSPKPIDHGLKSNIAALIDMMHSFGVPGWFGYAELEWSMNVVMFVPLGFCVTLALPAGKQWVAIVLLPLTSIAIETAQYFLLPARFATVEDVLANSLGGLIGFLIAVALRALVHRRDATLRGE